MRKTKVPGKVARDAQAAQRPVPAPQRAVAAEARGPEPSNLARSRALIRRGQGAATSLMLDEAAARGWGTRGLALGASGVGKTYFLGRLCAEILARHVADLVLVHDAKDPAPQYEGTVRSSLAELAAKPPGAGESAVVVVHDRVPRESADAVAAAGLALGARGAGLRVAVVIDELYSALKGRQTFASGATGPIPMIFREGRSQGVSIFASTQIPQSLPTEPLDLSDAIALFRVDGRSLNYVAGILNLEADATTTASRLARGEFLLIRAGMDWDRTIYGPAW